MAKNSLDTKIKEVLNTIDKLDSLLDDIEVMIKLVGFKSPSDVHVFLTGNMDIVLEYKQYMLPIATVSALMEINGYITPKDFFVD